MVLSKPTIASPKGQGISLISYVSLTYNLVSAQFSIDGLAWNEGLSCHQCIRGGHKFVYENVAAADGQYFKDIPRDSDITGFCCDGDTCEEEPEPEDPRIAEMWEFFESAQPNSYADIVLYLTRVNEFEGRSIYDFFVQKLIALQNLESVQLNDFSALTALKKNLRNRVLYYEIKKAVGQKLALEYMDLIADVKELETVAGSPVTTGAAELYYDELKDDLWDSSLTTWSHYTEAAALAKIDALKKFLLWTDIHLNTSTSVKEEMEELIEEVETYEGTSYSNFYMKYLWKYYNSKEDAKEDNYMRALYELRTRALNIRMTQLKGLEIALKFNIHLMELKYYAGREDQSSVLIESATAYNDFVESALADIGTNTDDSNSAHVAVADDLIEDLDRTVLWDFFAINTSVADRNMYRDVYIAVRGPGLNTRLGVSEDHQAVQEGLLQDEKDLLNNAQDNDFQTIWDDFKLKIMYMQFKADVQDYDDDYDATDGVNSISLYINSVTADDELKDTIFPNTDPGLDIDRAAQITLEEGLWTDLSGGDSDAYTDKFYEYRKEYMESNYSFHMDTLMNSGFSTAYYTQMVQYIPAHWCTVHTDADADLYTVRKYVRDSIVTCVDTSSCETYLKNETVALFEHLYNAAIGDQYDEDSPIAAVDDNETSYGMGFIDNIWKVLNPTLSDQMLTIAEAVIVGTPATIVVNMIHPDALDTTETQFKAFRYNHRYWYLKSHALRDRVTPDPSSSVMNAMWTKHNRILDLLLDGVFEEYTTVGDGSAFDDGRGFATIDEYLFKYAVDDSGYRVINEAEWLVDVYDYSLKRWLKLVTEDVLDLVNEKDPSETYADFDASDPEGYPGPTINCLWDEMTDLGMTETQRRDFAYDNDFITLHEDSSEEEDDLEDFMKRWYLKQLELRFKQTFDVNGDDVDFADDEKADWQALLTEVEDYPDWADAEHIALYELGTQSVYERTSRYVKMTQDVSSDVCTAKTDYSVYEEYRNDLREWLLWSFCASITDLQTEYQDDNTVSFTDHISDDITPERCHTLNFMLDYLASDEAPHIDAFDSGDPDNNYEQDFLKQAYILRLDARKTALVDKLDAQLASYDAPAGKNTPMWEEYIAFKDEFEQVFGEVERRMNLEFQKAFDDVIADDTATYEIVDQIHHRLLYLRKSADFDILMGLPDQTFAERQALFFDDETGWYPILEDAIDSTGDSDEWDRFTSLVDGHYLPLFFKKLEVLEAGELEQNRSVVGADPDHDGTNDVFYGGISLPTYSCAPFNDDEDDEPDNYFNINADSNMTDAYWMAYWIRQIVFEANTNTDITSAMTDINAAHDVLV